MKTIIHVEDSELIQRRLAEWVRSLNPEIHVLAATTLARARQLVALNKPDFMVLDINLPDGNATSCIAEFKSLAPEMPIAILSNSSDPFTRTKCLLLGADWFFDKATEIAKVISLLNTANTPDESHATSYWRTQK